MIFQKSPVIVFSSQNDLECLMVFTSCGWLPNFLRRKIFFSEHNDASHLKSKAAILNPSTNVYLGREIIAGYCNFRTCCIFPPRSSSMRLNLQLWMGWTNQSSPRSQSLSCHRKPSLPWSTRRKRTSCTCSPSTRRACCPPRAPWRPTTCAGPNASG